MLTPEFKDFYNVTFGKTKGLKGQLSLSDIKSDIERLKDTVTRIGNNPRQLEEYLQRASASSQTEVLCTLYMVLDQIDFDLADKSIMAILFKFTPELQDIKEFNSQNKVWKS